MQTPTTFALLVLVSVGFANGQDEGLLGLPVDFDIFGQDADLYKDQDIFKDDTYAAISDKSVEDIIRRICNEYDLILDNHSIDCKSISLAQKALNIYEHNIHKRETGDETQLEEGSGAGEEEHEPEAESILKVSPGLSVPEEPLTETKANDTVPANSEGEQTIEKAPTEVKEEPAAEISTNEEAKVESAIAVIPGDQLEQEPNGNETAQPEGEQPKEESPAEAGTAAEGNVEAPPEVNAEGNVEAPPEVNAEVPVSEAKKTEDAVAPAGDETPPEEKQSVTESTVLFKEIAVAEEGGVETVDQKPEISVEEKQAVTESVVLFKEVAVAQEGGINKKGRVLKPEVIKSDNDVSGNAEVRKANTEQINDHQSGNAIVEGAGGSGTLEASDTAVKQMETNANLKQATADSEDQKTGESAREIKQGRKDTKVLIILFVAVVVVGGAAFAYNFIKKRKQKKAEATRTENGSNNTTKRSLQNATNSTKSDPEQGTELKPLMKSTADQKPVVAEFTDEKENGKAETSK